MTHAYAAEVVTWRYPLPYDCYDMTAVDPAVLADPATGFYALLDDGDLIGFRSFGSDGQVPGGTYDESALDTGGGLRPDLVGRGLGFTAIGTGLAFGREQFRPDAFRVTIAAFNRRALHVLERLGFIRCDRFLADTDASPYEILIRAEVSRPR